MGSNRVSEIRVNENRVRNLARVTKFRVRANFRVSRLRAKIRLRLRATMCFKLSIVTQQLVSHEQLVLENYFKLII